MAARQAEVFGSSALAVVRLCLARGMGGPPRGSGTVPSCSGGTNADEEDEGERGIEVGANEDQEDEALGENRDG